MDLYLASVLTNMTLIAFLALSAYLVLVVGEVSFGQQAFFCSPWWRVEDIPSGVDASPWESSGR